MRRRTGDTLQFASDILFDHLKPPLFRSAPASFHSNFTGVAIPAALQSHANEIIDHFLADFAKQIAFFFIGDGLGKHRRTTYYARRVSDGHGMRRERARDERISSHHGAVADLRAWQDEDAPRQTDAVADFNGRKIHWVSFKVIQRRRMSKNQAMTANHATVTDHNRPGGIDERQLHD